MQLEAGVEEIPHVILTSDQSVCNKQECKNEIFHCQLQTVKLSHFIYIHISLPLNSYTELE